MVILVFSASNKSIRSGYPTLMITGVNDGGMYQSMWGMMGKLLSVDVRVSARVAHLFLDVMMHGEAREPKLIF
jgi:hypothetical protein